MTQPISPPVCGRLDWTGIVRDLAPTFAARAADHDRDGSFVADNYADLKAAHVFTAAVPAEFGGGDATYGDLSDMLRTLAHACPSTALALAMHTHVVATAAWRWKHDGAPVEGLLRRVAAEQIVLVSSGGSDWIEGSGVAERAEGGWRITARKVFASGVPAGDLLVTSAIHDDPADGPVVLHFAVPLRAPGVTVLDTWNTIGMRGTGSHDVQLDGVFVPDAAVSGRRPAGRWHRLFHIVSLVALPLICSVYVGIAEAAREAALAGFRPRRDMTEQALVAGEMENALAAARLALDDMVSLVATAEPGPATTSAVMTRRTLATTFAAEAVGKAIELAGGRAFYRGSVLERLGRDVQAGRYHPLQEKTQLLFTGRVALGLDIDAPPAPAAGEEAR